MRHGVIEFDRNLSQTTLSFVIRVPTIQSEIDFFLAQHMFD